MNNLEILQADIAVLEESYKGRKPYHGELHDHSDSGGTSDGAVPLAKYKEEMLKKGMDFAAILDHRQVRHMYLDEFDRGLFICGTEPGTRISDSTASKNSLHYNMMFPNPDGLHRVLEDFPEFEFTGGREGHFKYPEFTASRFTELIDSVFSQGGFLVIPHPKQVMESDDPFSYRFRDYIGTEVFYNDFSSEYTAENYALWVELLRLGCRIWACAGGDMHEHPGTGALTTVYSDRQHGSAYIPYLRQGDFTCGGVGVRMLINDTRSGGHIGFSDGRLIAAVGDFHDSVIFDGHEYIAEILDDNGVVLTAGISTERMNYFALDADKNARFYRIEVKDKTSGFTVAIGNPIWNDNDFSEEE